MKNMKADILNVAAKFGEIQIRTEVDPGYLFLRVGQITLGKESKEDGLCYVRALHELVEEGCFRAGAVNCSGQRFLLTVEGQRRIEQA